MPLGLNINNPQEENPLAAVSPTVTLGNNTFGGNVLGGGSSSTSASSDGEVSTILIYGVLGLGAIWILQRLDQ